MSKTLTVKDAMSGLQNLLVQAPAEASQGDAGQAIMMGGDSGQPTEILEVPAPPVAFEEKVQLPDPKESLDDDFWFARRILHSTLVQAQQVATSAAREAALSGNPRSIEAAQLAIKAVSDITLALLDLSTKKRKLDSETSDGPNINFSETTVNNLSMDPQTTQEMLDFLKTADRIRLQPYQMITDEAEFEELKQDGTE